MNRLLTRAEVCERLRISRRTFHRLQNAGEIRPTRFVGARKRYATAEIDRATRRAGK